MKLETNTGIEYDFAVHNWGWIEPTAEVIEQAELALDCKKLKTGEIVKRLSLFSEARCDELVTKALANRDLKVLDAMVSFASESEVRIIEQNKNRILSASRGIQCIHSVVDENIQVSKEMDRKEVKALCDEINAVIAVVQDKTPVIVFAEMNNAFHEYSTMSEQQQRKNPIFRAIESPNPRFALAANSEVLLEANSVISTSVEDDDSEQKVMMHKQLVEDSGLRKLAQLHKEAINLGATDIHISPDITSRVVRVETRLHTRLRKLENYSLNRNEYQRIKKYLLNISGAVKDGQELKREADGRYTYMVHGMRIHVRAGFIAMGTDHRLNNNLVVIRLRLLPVETGAINLLEKGMPQPIVEQLQASMYKSHGLVLTVGPTGAGKSTTMLGLVELDRNVWDDEKSRISIEDPVEREVPGIDQIQKKTMPGESDEDAFKSYLEAYMRLDPDFLVMGEIRSKVTAQLATQFSITGHKTLATLHANDTLEAVERLLDLAESSSLRSMLINALQVIIAQRLYPKVCPECAISTDVSSANQAYLGSVLSKLDIADIDVPTHSMEISKGGCESCNYEGTAGVVPSFEVLEMKKEVKDLALSSDIDVYKKIPAHRFWTMEKMLFEHVNNGLTPLSSLLGSLEV